MRRPSFLFRLIKNREGAAALEFALVMVPFLALTMAIIETTVLAFTDAVLQAAVANTARMVRTGQTAVLGSSGASAFSTAVCNQLYGLADCSKLVFDLRSFSSFSAISIPVPDASGGTSGASYSTGSSSSASGAADVVTARVIYPYSFLTPGLSYFLGSSAGQTVNLVYTVVFQNEPY
ncbi:MAG TPA: TadE/TadG family type IV pilus assembly protein [Candidatus Sulfotelmatobacter sp.]|jgi:Flp pilus assembly protein TadG|nr:TadE/TadG family type IV pilus assembly protein [Candidatus Sulfotelmatobacter sp.]